MFLHPFLYVVRCHLMNLNSWWLTCTYSFHFCDVGSQTALNRVFYFENLSSEAVQIAHISEDWLIRATQKVISWGEMQYAGSPCMRQTEKSVQRECHRNPKQHIPRVRKRLQLLHCLTGSTRSFLKTMLSVPEYGIMNKRRVLKHHLQVYLTIYMYWFLISSYQPKIEWLKNQMIIGDDPKFRQISNQGICSLEIRKPCSFDGGVYTCRAKNAQGEATVSCKLEVKRRCLQQIAFLLFYLFAS